MSNICIMHIWCVCLVTIFYLTLYPIYSVHIISFRECIERSNVLDWEEQEDIPSSVLNQQNNVNVIFHRLVLRPNTLFIFGGDTVDKVRTAVVMIWGRVIVFTNSSYSHNHNTSLSYRDQAIFV